MKRNVLRAFRLLSISAFAFLAASCGEEIPGSDGRTGAIALNLRTDATVNVPAVGTRASETLHAPDAESFSISLEGPSSGSWTGISSFPSNQQWAVGHYSLTASYGTKDAEGFEWPYFTGTSEFDVREGETTSVEVEATLANTLLTFEYSDSFTAYFREIKAMAESQSGNRISVDYGETRPIYMNPGPVRLYLQVKVPSGATITLQPAAIENALPRTHYHVRFDYSDAGVGTGAISVKFVEETVEEKYEIDLSDELINSEPPTISLAGAAASSTATSPLPMLQGFSASGNPHFFVRADAGVGAALLTVDDALAEILGSKQIELEKLSDVQRAELTAKGISMAGISDRKSKVASVNIAGIGTQLQGEGTEHWVRLEIKDVLTRVSEPQTIYFKGYPFVFEFDPGTSDFGSDIAVGHVSFNGDATMLRNQLALKVSANGTSDWSDAKVLSVSEGTLVEGQDASNPFPTYKYEVRFKVPGTTGEFYVQPFANNLSGAVGQIETVYPEYTVEVMNAFATYAYVRVASSKPEVQSLLTKSLRVFTPTATENPIEIKDRDAASGVIVLSNLTPGTNYSIETTLRPAGVSYSNLRPQDKKQFTLEAEKNAGVPNGDFEIAGTQIKFDNLAQGGPYTRTMISSNMQNHISYDLREPQGWATVNAKTASTSAKTQNSWFVVPSTYLTHPFTKVATVATQGGLGGQKKNEWNVPDRKSGNSAVVLLNVAWDPNGTTPDRDHSTKVPANYYCRNAGNPQYKAAGKLFLGSYSYSSPTSETYNEGVSFTSRPSALQGWYMLDISKGNKDGVDADKGFVRVQLLNGTSVLAEGEAHLAAASEYTQFTIPLTYADGKDTKKATHLRIFISSSDKFGTITEETSRIKCTSETSLHVQESVGSMLTIDNLTFSYTTPTNVSAKTSAARTSAKRNK